MKRVEALLSFIRSYVVPLYESFRLKLRELSVFGMRSMCPLRQLFETTVYSDSVNRHCRPVQDQVWKCGETHIRQRAYR
jgi:hypothetical protein